MDDYDGMNSMGTSHWSPSGSLYRTSFEPRPVLKHISVLIPTLGRPILEECLARIISGTRWPKALLVVHQGNEAYIGDWVNSVNEKGIEAVYMYSAEHGKPAAINLALTRVTTRFVCMIDDDCFVEPDWLQNMYLHLLKNPDWIITGRVEPAGNETVAIVQSREASVQSRPRLKFDMLVGGNMGVGLDVVRRIGLFDEDPLLRNAAEDVEWGYRALRKGILIEYAPEVVVSHYGWRDRKERSERLKSYGYGHGAFYGKYLRRGDLFILWRATGHLIRALRRWIRGKLRGDAELAILGKAYCLNLLPGLLAGLRSSIKPGKLE
jgi:GT2 family glycosyltransferase